MRFFILVLVVLVFASYGVLAKRGASNKTPLGKFRMSHVQKAKLSRPLSGRPGGAYDVELIEERKVAIAKKLLEADEKVDKINERRLHRRKSKMRDVAEKKKTRTDINSVDIDAGGGDDSEVGLPFSLQRETVAETESTSVEPRSQRSSPSSLKRLLAAR